MIMHRARALIPLVMWMAAAALPGCRREERAPSQTAASAVPSARPADSVAATTAAATDTPQAASTGPDPLERPNDCRYIGTRPRPRYGDPGFGQPYDRGVMKAGVPFRCRLRPEGPEVKLVVSGEDGIPMGVDVHSPPDAPRRMQQLLLDNSEGAYEGSGLLVGEDLNGDGWMDLRVNTYSGTGGQMFDVFRYEPAERRFVADTMLVGAMNVRRLPERGCIGTSSKTSAWDNTAADFCWSGGAWVMTRTYSQEQIGGGRIVRTERERRGGKMQVVRVDTLPTDAPY